MNFILHKADTRGYFDHGWLKTHHTFSFAQYLEPERMKFGKLRVINDDIIAPKEGFGKHPHDNMEIITIPIEGKLLHRDSMGNEEYIVPGEVQVMSAGTGIFHEEYNGSKNENLALLQIWIYPNEKNIIPTYNQKMFDANDALNKWQKLVTPDENGTLHIHQNATISRTFLTAGEKINYTLNPASYGSYVFLVEGELNMHDYHLDRRDGLGIYATDKFNITAIKDSYIINLEIPE
jgi:redox-sensitive bicupin YhaK (pirin superfamily)